MRKHLFAVLCACMLALVVLGAPSQSTAQVRISVAFGPPALPVYEQPICPGDGYIWTPGYWAWDDVDQDYYWVPGTWVLAPEVGYLWTPPWWGWEGGVYLFHAGWWGPHVGWYGGINYGFGYFGAGFVGGRWDGGRFFYNREVANINVVNIHNLYNEHIEYRDNHVSYNGGPGGLEARPRPEDERYDHERHFGPVAAQEHHIQEARGNRELRASVNQGRPSIAATARPGEFRGNAVPAREAGAPYRAPERGGNMARPENGGRPAVHPNELPKYERPAPPNTGNASRDRKYQQQQEKMYAKQDQQRQQLQQRQEQEHQRMQRAPEPQRQQMEQHHQQQTQQLQQRHQQEQQHLQQRQAPSERRK